MNGLAFRVKEEPKNEGEATEGKKNIALVEEEEAGRVGKKGGQECARWQVMIAKRDI